MQPNVVAKLVVEQVEERWNLQDDDACRTSSERQVPKFTAKRCHPKGGWLKINFDGSCGAGGAGVGVGVGVRDCVGKCILVAGKRVETSSIYETELMGAWLTVSVVHDQ